jgi:threonylcarbamoyladenosine tRNA methylthiotransferase CDKAL1
MRVFVKSFGCSTNLADGEVLAGCLQAAGYEVVDDVLKADLVVYNTCAVKGPTENRMISVLKTVPRGKKLIVGGCLPLINFERLRNEVRFDGLIGPAAGEKITEVAGRVISGEKVIATENAVDFIPQLCLPRKRINPVVSIIPVNYGCLGSCAYCCVVFARGRLRSYNVAEIVERVKKDVAEGTREFWITSQDAACYGRDRDTNLADLLNAICYVKGDFMVRVGMMTPNVVLDILEELIEAFRNEKIFKFVHLPVQSGDDQVLKRMRRFYSVNDFVGIVKTFRESFPEITLSTDAICGFPGETAEAFQKTLKLIEKVEPDIVNVSKFFARPRTPAIKMSEDAVSLVEIKRRSSVTTLLAKKVSYERNQRWVGWKGEVLVDEVGKVAGSWVGRNFAYKPIVVRSKRVLLGKKLQVEVVKACATYLEGKVSE